MERDATGARHNDRIEPQRKGANATKRLLSHEALDSEERFDEKILLRIGGGGCENRMRRSAVGLPIESVREEERRRV